MRREVEVMRVWRVPPMGKLIVEADHRRTATIDEITDPTVRQRLLAAIGELVTFAGGYQELVNQGFAPQLRGLPAPTVPGTDTPVEVEETSPPVETGSRERWREPIAEEAFLTDLEGENVPSLDLVKEINRILLRHQAAHPDLLQRAIELHSAPGGGLIIQVDGRYYDRPSDIEDKRVQSLIVTALQEWERG